MRIIAGQFRGRRLKAPRGRATRPTTDRVREALFSILGDISDFVVADCHAGTGALGLEALSRGARRVVFVESAEAACRAISANIESLGVQSSATLVCESVERAEKRITPYAPFDVVLSDPPWPIAGPAALRVARLFSKHLAAGGMIVLGHPARAALDLPSDLELQLVDRRAWGDSAMSWYAPRTRT